MDDRNDEPTTRRPSWLFIISLLLALLFACLGLMLILGRLPGLEPTAAREQPITLEEVRARAGFPVPSVTYRADAATGGGW